MASQLEQLLTCCICLDRFRNPKLLPCQHSVCMEPCMEGLVDYVRRQVKCPECRAEHRIPYNGVQGFPSNVTLQRFLEAHIEITGETPDPFTGQIMERCGVCNEKNYLTTCTHCDKKICADCKAAHNDILKREIGRINNQVKRAVHRLGDQLSIVDRNLTALKQNSDSVKEEVDNIGKRLTKAIRDRTEFVKTEILNYYNTEHRHLTVLKESLEQEISNVDSNSELADKHMDDQTPWDDNELMDTKDIFLRTVEFIRSFDSESGDYNRRARFNAPDDINKLASNLSTLGDLVIHNPKQTMEGFGPSGGTSGLQSGLMKSKSDHRLAAQFRDQDEGGYGYGSSGRTSPVSRRRFGDRPHVVEEPAYDSPSSSEVGGRRKFRSRFMRRGQGGGEDEDDRSVRFNDDDGPQSKPRPKVIDTEDASRGPLSGITRIIDSPRVIKRLQEKEGKFKKKEEPPKPVTPTPKATPITFGTPRKAARQTSEDEIDKIKKQNKSDASASPSASATSSASSTTAKPSFERLSSIKDNERASRSDRTSSSPRSSTHSPSATAHEEEPSRRTSRDQGNRFDFPAANASSTAATPARKTSVDSRTYPFSRSSSTSSVGDSGKAATRASRSDSTDSNLSAEGSAGKKKTTSADTKTTAPASPSATSATRYQSRFLARAGTPSAEASKESGNDEEEEESSEDSESEESEESSEEEEEEDKAKSVLNSRSGAGLLLGRSANHRDTLANDSGYGSSSSRYGSASNSNDSTSSRYGTSNNDTSGRYGTVVNSNDTSSRYGTAVNSNDTSSRYGTAVNSNDTSSRYGTVVNSNDTSGRYGTPVNSNDTSSRYGTTVNSNDTGSGYKRSSYLDSSKTAKDSNDDIDSKYPYASKFLNRSRPAEEETKPSFQSRFLNKSKSSAVLGPDAGNDDDSHSSTSGTGSSRAKFDELKERRQRLARSKSSAGLDEEETTPSSTTDSTSASSSSYRNRYGRDSDTGSSTAASRAAANSSASAAGSEDAPANQLSNWARYLKNKYGNKTTITAPPSTASSASSSGASPSALGKSSSTSTPTSRSIARSRSSHLLGLAKENDSLEDDSKNVHATPTSPAAVGTLGHHITPFGNIHRSQYLQKQKLIFKIGSRGSEAGHFTWPRGIAVGPDDSIVVADSSNHRVQVFNAKGRYVKDFGAYGNGDGEFDCLAGVAVNRTGHYIIADRYNHRIQIFDPSGSFLRSFGSQGSGDGKFCYPWGVTTDSLGFIYICDKENHRIQVFQSDGSFVGKFGSLGSKVGQLEHPHYVAVSSDKKVIVSDSNNHRIQIFDINGKVLTAFGAEGSDDGQFKFPRGVAVDEQGYIFVADSGNNRIQIFHPDGAFLRAFGCWGSADGEFKGLEGVGVMANGNILICDRENHRVQVF